MEIKHRARQLGVAMEILQTPYLGPGRIHAQSGDAQAQVHYPDAEILAPAAGKPEAVRFIEFDGETGL